jgi:TrmH family RNA methyltransferase
MSYPHIFEKLSKTKVKFIKSLGLKKFRNQESMFVIEGAKNIIQLLHSNYHIHMVVGTVDFLTSYYDQITKRTQAIFQVTPELLAYLGSFQSNHAGLAVATVKANDPIEISQQEYGLVLDQIQDPGNLGTIIRIADWYAIKHIICSLNTVELYNPKVLHASMGSFINVQLYYTDLVQYLSCCTLPILGTFTVGEDIHRTDLPAGGWVIIGHESSGISKTILPYIQKRISIPKYGQAESLNAAIAAAVVCDNLKRTNPRSALKINFNP